MRKINFVNEQYYHIYNRGVEKRNIFLDNGDYVRFIHYLYALNDSNPSVNLSRSIYKQNNEGGRTFFVNQKRELIVKIHAFCLMPNHYHLILEQSVEGGIIKFMQKLGTAYAMFFNTKYKRSGVLFQGKFKATIIDNDAYFMQLLRYIHLNPVGLIDPNWKTEGISNPKKIQKYLNSYRWSSHPDYIGKENFSSVSYRDFAQLLFTNVNAYQDFINQYLAEDFDNIKDFTLE